MTETITEEQTGGVETEDDLRSVYAQPSKASSTRSFRASTGIAGASPALH